MRKIGSKKRFALIATTTAAVLIGSGVAVAFWTTTGSGTGTANTGTTTGVTSNAATINNLYPGIAPVAIDVTVANTDAVPQTISVIDVSIASITGAGTDGLKPPCTAADYAITDGTATGANNVAASGSTPFPGGGAGSGATITMLNTAANQDNCKGATVNLAIAVS